MNPYPYSLTELIQDDDFIAWVLHPNEASNARWNQFLQDFPKKGQTVEDAKGYVILLAEDTGRHPPTPEQRTKMWGVVEAFIESEEEASKNEKIPLARLPGLASWFLLLLMIGLLSYWYYNTHYLPSPMLTIGR